MLLVLCCARHSALRSSWLLVVKTHRVAELARDKIPICPTRLFRPALNRVGLPAHRSDPCAAAGMEKLCPVSCLLPAAAAMACLPKLKVDFFFLRLSYSGFQAAEFGKDYDSRKMTALLCEHSPEEDEEGGWCLQYLVKPTSCLCSSVLPATAPRPAGSCPPGSAGPGRLPPA